MVEPPAHLTASVSLLESYLDRLPEVPFVAIGNFGVGRGYWIEAVLRARGFSPLWLYENEEAPSYDAEERRIFPVYDLPTPEVPATIPGILLAPDPVRSTGFEKAESVVFPALPVWERERFLQERGADPRLADGNPTYPDLLFAAEILASSGVVVRAAPPENPSWASFRAGGEPPVKEALLAYYAAYAFPPQEWWPNRNLGLARRVPASIGRLLMNQLRLEWPSDEVAFPAILREPRQSRRAKEAHAGTSRDVPVIPKTYAVDWS